MLYRAVFDRSHGAACLQLYGHSLSAVNAPVVTVFSAVMSRAYPLQHLRDEWAQRTVGDERKSEME